MSAGDGKEKGVLVMDFGVSSAYPNKPDAAGRGFCHRKNGTNVTEGFTVSVIAIVLSD